MNRRFNWFVVICIACILLSACKSDDQEEHGGSADVQTTKNSTSEVTDSSASDEQKSQEEKTIADLIGERISIEADGTIQLPIKDQVLEVAYSDDGRVKLFESKSAVYLINGDEIIHAEEANSIIPPAVSSDGRFASWNTGNDWEIAVFDLENNQLDYVEATETHDPYDVQVLDFPKIKKHGDTYYLMENEHMAGVPGLGALDLQTKQIYSSQYEEDLVVLEEIAPTEEVVDSDTYHTYEAETRQLLSKNDEEIRMEIMSSEMYYEVHYSVELDEEENLYATKVYGVEAPKARVMEIPFEEEGIELGKDAVHLRSTLLVIEDMKVADNGNVLLPLFEEDSGAVKLSVYQIDLSEDSPHLHLMLKEDVTNYPEERPFVLFNEDASGFYLSDIEGVMEYYDFP